MPLADVHSGMDCTGETVVQGTTISSFGVHVIDVVQAPSGSGILVSVSGPAVDRTGVAEGMSGSPVYCQDSSGTLRNAGAIAAGVGEYGNKVALVTPIEEMLGEPAKPPSGAPRLVARTRSLLGPLTVGGLSPALLSVLQQAGKRVGRAVMPAPPSPGPAMFPVQDLVPGASVATQYSIGTVTTGAIGTVTYRDGPTVYAFGHPLDDAGRRALLLSDAYVYYVVNGPDPAVLPSYKLAAPGHTLGTLTSDTPNAVIGELGAPPAMVPVQVTAHDLDTGQVISEQTRVADETAAGQPTGGSQLTMIAPLAAGQAAIDVYNGPPANESGRVCLRVVIRESPRSLGFCKRYVGTGAPGGSALVPPELSSGVATDVGTAFGLLDQVQFAQLHITSVQATIYAQRGLAEASIVDASARPVVKAGRAALVRLRVRMFRGRLRTIAFRVRIPRSARGLLLVTIKGPPFSPTASAGNGGPLGALLGFSLAGQPPPGPPPPSIAALRSSIDAISGYDGLSVSLNGGSRHHAYRDPSLLISGRATLALLAVR
jgi:hypothetical protein